MWRGAFREFIYSKRSTERSHFIVQDVEVNCAASLFTSLGCASNVTASRYIVVQRGSGQSAISFRIGGLVPSDTCAVSALLRFQRLVRRNRTAVILIRPASSSKHTTGNGLHPTARLIVGESSKPSNAWFVVIRTLRCDKSFACSVSGLHIVRTNSSWAFNGRHTGF